MLFLFRSLCSLHYEALHVWSCPALCLCVFSVLLAFWSPCLGKRELVFVLNVHLFVNYAHVNLCHFFSSSWCQGLAATSACGSSWTFLFTFLHVTPVVFVLCGKPFQVCKAWKGTLKISPNIHLMALLFQVPGCAQYSHSNSFWCHFIPCWRSGVDRHSYPVYNICLLYVSLDLY